MAANFKFFIHRNSESIHMKLFGDFDGTSAHELVSALKKNCGTASKIFIHTNSLNKIHPFGRETFLNNLDFLNDKSPLIFFTGEDASQLAPENKTGVKTISC
ncbi:MAG: hypothetical protein B1H11_09595 [Desulfobacteraceae bacterium 4484_190.1]|nr:hypothetical protein [Deltaproteobacteria bacterium]OPX35147.1 MAG: hypothetical protein B1H11_09595 [Desulfobacteraceae bacterium 4484_190.1]